MKAEKKFYLLLAASAVGLAAGISMEKLPSPLLLEEVFLPDIRSYLRMVHPFMKISLLLMIGGCTIYALPCSTAVMFCIGVLQGGILRQNSQLADPSFDIRLWGAALLVVTILYLFVAQGLHSCRLRAESPGGRMKAGYLFRFLTLSGIIALILLLQWLLSCWFSGSISYLVHNYPV